MVIAVYADNLRVFTSMMPQRGLLKQMMVNRPFDNFIFYLHKRFLSDTILSEFFSEIAELKNWEIRKIKRAQRLSRLLQVVGLPSPLLPRGADLYISPDIETFGKRCRPILNFLPDLTVYDDMRNTSLSRFNSWFRKICIRLMDRRSNLVVVVSQYTRSRYLHHFPGTRVPVKVIYNGIDSQWFNQEPTLRDGSLPQSYWIWMGGGFTSRKNLEGLLEAYKLLIDEKNALPDIILAGLDSDSIERMRAHLITCELTNRVHLKSKIPLQNLISLVDQSEGLLFPSLYEGFGLPVIEAYARGKMVMTSTVTSLPEVANGLAVFCDPANIESIKQSLLTMTKSSTPASVEELRTWASRFTYAQAASRLEELILTIPSKIK